MRDLKLNGALFEPRQEFLGIKCEIAAQKFMRAGWRAIHVLGKFNPDQPRDDQGRWTDTGGGDGTTGSDGELILTGSGGYLVDMLEEEGLGGHAIERHVAKPEDYLKARILGSRTNIAGIVTFGEARAGSFTSLEAANKLVNSIFSQNQEKVDAFVEGRFPSSLPFMLLFAQFDSPTGYEAYARNPRTQPVMRSTSGVTVLILRSDRTDKGYYVETAWPMNED